MSQVLTDCRWGVLKHSQRGASHAQQDLPNQDAIAHSLADDGSPPVIMAVADGHGSVKSFRSDVGARIAVETAIAVCREFLDGVQGSDPSVVKSDAELRIPPRIFQEWKRRVQEHFRQYPFTEAELVRLAEQAGPAARERATRAEELAVAYGSTLLTAVLTNKFLICFQLGDGDILAVPDDSGVAERAIPKDEALIANETTSLCQDDGLRYVPCRFQLFQGAPPAMVLLSTDGYCNSFASPDAFLKTGTECSARTGPRRSRRACRGGWRTRPATAAAIHALAEKAAARLGMQRPEVFVSFSPTINACAKGVLGRKSVVLNSALVEAMDHDELLQIVGHEFSHIKCGHTAPMVLLGSSQGVPVPGISHVLGFIFRWWSRKAEYTCDRGGLIACRNPRPAVISMCKLAVGPELFKRMNVADFLNQQQDLDQNQVASLSETLIDHPYTVRRIHAIQAFHASGEYGAITRRSP